MKKFWNKASDGSSDIFIYGDIVNYDWFDSDVTAKKFVEDLNSFDGKPVTVHVNSGGGDVFAALAIYNTLRNYKGGITVAIDGLAASAASLIAMGGNKITMANNALMMIHEPSVGLFDFMTAADLAKIQEQLSAVHDSIVTTYKNRAPNADIEKMVAEETWLNANAALEAGFIDEITGEVEIKVDDAQKKLFVNKLSVSTKNFDVAKMRRAMEVKNMDIKDEKNFFEKMKSTIMDALTPKDEGTKPAENKPAEVVDMAAIRQQELKRIRDLQALKCGDKAVDALIDVAVSEGKEVAEVQKYIDAVKKIPAAPTPENAAEKIVNAIREQMQSGAEDVQSGDPPKPTDKEIKDLQAKKIVEIANGLV